MLLKEVVMGRYAMLIALSLGGLISAIGLLFASTFIWPLLVFSLPTILGFRDCFNSMNLVRANYPLMVRLRYLLESIRPELR